MAHPPDQRSARPSDAGVSPPPRSAARKLAALGLALVAIFAAPSVKGACPTVTISPSSLSSATVGAPYSRTVTASGGSAPYTYSLYNSSLPPGLSLNSSTGEISGTPTSAGSTTFTIRARDKNFCSGFRNYTVARSCPTLTFSPSTLDNGRIGNAYSETITATGNSSLTFSISNGSLPLGLSLNSSTGVISGTPTSSYPNGQYFRVRATSPYNCTSTRNYSLRICPVITLGSLVNGTAGSSYSDSAAASGGDSPYVYSVASGSLPTGLSLSSSSGAVTGTLRTSTPTTFTIQAIDEDTCVGTRTYTISPACPAMSISPSSVPAGKVGSLYLQQLLPSGGTSPRTFSISSGSLPPGLALTSDTGYIWGWPTEAGGEPFTVTVTDAYGCTTSRTYTVSVCANISVGSTMAGAGANTDYSGTIAATGGVAPYTYTLTGGSLPSGMTLAANGTVSGRCLTMGTYAFDVSVTDANGCEGSGTVSLTVGCPVVTITPGAGALPHFTIGSHYSQTLEATPENGLTAQYFSGKDFSNLLLTRKEPSIDYDWGSGSPHANVPADDFCVRWTGTVNVTTGGSYTVSVTADDGIRLWFDGYLVIDQWKDQAATTYTVTGNLGENSKHSIKVEFYERGGAAVARVRWSGPGISLSPITQWQDYTWSLANGSLPSGLTLNASTGAIEGTPQAGATNASFTVRATDSDGCTATQAYTLAPNCTPMTVEPASFAGGTVGSAYSGQVTVSGGSGPFTYAINSGALPAGLTLNSTTGAITGTPTAAGTATFALRVTDVNNCVGTSTNRSITTTCPAMTITTASLPAGVVGSGYSQTLNVNGGSTPRTFAIVSGTLPAGLTFNTSTGQFGSTPTAANGSGASITVRVTDAYGCVANQTYNLKICPIVALSPSTLPGGTVGTSYNQQVTASGGASAYAYAISGGTLPTGLALNPSTGAITGTMTASGTYAFTVAATDANGCAGTRGYSVMATCPTVTVSPATLPVGLAGSTYSQIAAASGGNAPYTYSISAGTLPAGLNLNTATGEIWGTPSAGNSAGAAITVRAVDKYGCIGSRSYNLKICPVVAVGPTTLPDAVIGISYSRSVAGSNGVGPYTYSISGGALPAGLSLNSGTGAITGTPSTLAPASFTVRAVDSNGCAATRSYSVPTVCPSLSLTPASLAPAFQSSSYSASVAAAGGAAPYNYAITSGTLPPGLTLDASTGTISGTPSAGNGAGVNVTITATDANGCTGLRTYLMVVCPVVTVGPETVPDGTVGTLYSQTVSGSNGAGSYTFAVASGSLPAGITFNSSTGVLSGTPAAQGNFGFTVRATDENGCSGTRAYTVAIACPAVMLAPAGLASGAQGSSYSQTVSATGGTAPHTYAVSAGALPAGLTLNSGSGLISGTPTAGNGAGASVTIMATDAYGCTGSRSYSIKICPTIAINPAALPNGTVGTAYDQIAAASGGVAPYDYSISSGALPAGLSLDVTTGRISGTPQAESSGSFVVRAVDAHGCVGTRSYSVDIVCPGVTVGPATLAAGTVGGEYLQTLTATGGTAPKTFALAAGSLPAGLTLDGATGIISGTPTSGNGSGVSVTIRATDALGCSGTQTYNVLVCPALNLSSAALASAVVGTGYSQSITASGGAAPYAFAVIGGTLPTGLTLNAATGGLSGTPTAGGTFNFTVRATDANGCSATRPYSITSACPAMNLSPATLAAGVQSSSYSQMLSATGGTAPRSFSITSGSLPAGLSLNASTGLISGTPTAGNGAGVTIRATVTDVYGCTASRDYLLKICPIVLLAPATLPQGQVATAYNQTLTASGGTQPYVYSLSFGTLPAGYTLNSSTGVISGTATTAVTSTFTVRAVDANGCAGSRTYSLAVGCPTMAITTSSLANGIAGETYTQSLAATGGTAPRVFSVSSGALPAGLTLNSATGVISGTPANSNGNGVTVGITVTDLYDCSVSKNFTLKVCSAITINPTMLASGTVGTSYSQSLSASGGGGPYTFSVASGTLPAGLSLNSSAGLISGTPTVSGSAAFIIRATDVYGCAGTRSYSVDIACSSVAIGPSSNFWATLNTGFSQTLTASGGVAPYTWVITNGTLPAGLSFNPATGVVAGTPTGLNGAGTAVTFRATDNFGCTGTASITFVVCPAITISPASLTAGVRGVAYSQTLTATGATAPYTFSVASGSVPPGMSLNGDGTLSGTPTSGGTFSFTARATAANGCYGTRNCSLTISTPRYDFGDYSGFGAASAEVTSGLYLGFGPPDSEAFGSVNTEATGDDLDGTDDEDGISFESLVQGETGRAAVRITNTEGMTAFLSIWIDWNRDGILSDSTERVVNKFQVRSGTNNESLTFSVPAGAVPGTTVARAVLSHTGNPSAVGEAQGMGEVEDYRATVRRPIPAFTILVVNYNNNTISRFTGLTGSALTAWSPSGLSQPNYGYRMSDNSMFVANGNANTITRYNPYTGAYLGTLVSSGQGLNFPYQMAVNLDGSVYIANQNADNVLRFHPTTGAIQATVLSTNNPAGLAFDSAGRMYLTQNQSAGTLRMYTSSGTLLSTIATWPSGEYPRGLAWGPDGRLYVNVRNNNAATGRIDAITFPNGTRSTFVNMDSGSNPYTGIKWGPDGNVYICDYGESELQVYSGTGSHVRTLSSTLSGPHAVMFTDTSAATTDFGDNSEFQDASSTWSTTVRLGIECDTEVATRASLLANGDDVDDSDDEDGVTVPASITVANNFSLPIKLLNTSGSSAYLSVWIDFNRNGILENGERVVTNHVVPTGTNGVTQNFTITVPTVVSSVVGAMVGGTSAMVPGNAGIRVRLTSVSNAGPTGHAGIGEVEDYLVTQSTQPMDYGDDNRLASASSIVNSNLRIGATATDADPANPANDSATGDDFQGSDDEDATLPNFFLGSSSTISLSLFNNRGATAYLSGWIDWNGDGSLNGTGEAVIPETSISSSASPQTRNFTVTAPSTVSLGTPISLRLRLASAAAIPTSGSHGFGEVEDHQFVVQCPPITLTPATLPNGTIGTAYSHTVTAAGGTAPYTYAVHNSSLPAWAALNTGTGVISGTPNSSTPVTFTILATDAAGCSGTRAYTIAPACPTVAIATATLTGGLTGNPYEQTLVVAGGNAPYTWAISSGTLPAGLTFNASTGSISGTPTASNGGGTSLVFRVTDANGCQGLRTLSMRVCPSLAVNPETLPNPVLGGAYTQPVTASGGSAPYIYAVSSGSLPAGLTLNTSTGAITGNATSTTTATFTIRATDTNGCQGERSYSVAPFCATITLNPATLPNGVVGSAYSQTVGVSGGLAPFTFDVSNGNLPAGLTLNATTGALTGTPVSTSTATFTVRVTAAYGCQGVRTYTVTPVCPAITVTPGSLASGKIDAGYSQTLTAAGGAGPYTWSVVSGALPAGLGLNASTGVISGTPVASNGAGATVTIRATDSRGCTAQITDTIIICPVVALSPSSLPNGSAGTPYAQSVTAGGGQSPYVYAITDGALPEGLNLNASTGQISGLPNTDNTTTFTITATDANGCEGSKDYSITAGCPSITIAPTTLAGITVGSPYSQALSPSPGGANSYTWAVTNGSLPAGITLDAETGDLSGTVTATGNYSFTVRATHNNGCFATRPYSGTVACPVMTITSVALASPAVGQSYSQSFTVTGNTSSVTWTLDEGSLPAGLTLSPSGTITGVPTSTSAATFTAKATDTFGCEVTREYTLTPRALRLGNQVWVDMNYDGLRQSAEAGLPGLRLELWSPGTNGLRENGAGDDVKAAADVFTDSSGAYAFTDLPPGSYYVRIPAPPHYYPTASVVFSDQDDGKDNDSNGIQASGSGTAVVSPVIALAAGSEPGSGVDGDDADSDATVDFGFANLDVCYGSNLIDNPSFEFQQMPNTTGTLTGVLGYNGPGTSFGTGFNAFQWVGGTNGSASLGAPIQRVQVTVGTAGSKVAWLETIKARHGRRALLLQGSDSAVSLRAAGGETWGGVIVPGHEYQLSVWAASASSAAASVTWDLAANSQIFQVITGGTPGVYDHYTVPQSEMVATETGEQQCCGSTAQGTSLSAFGPADYNEWTEAVSNGLQPMWRQFTWRFRVPASVTAAELDNAVITLSGGSGTAPVLVDHVALCRVAPTNTLTLGNQIWNDLNNNGLRDGFELGVGGVPVQLFTSENDVAGDADDVAVGATTSSAAGVYNFTSLSPGKYVVKVYPPANLPAAGGTPVALDNGVNNDNNGNQPGGPGTPLFSPVTTLAFGSEPTNDADGNADTDLSIDFGLFSGLQIGNQIWADANNDGVFQSGTESGIAGVAVQLLNGETDAVLATTATNSGGIYAFTTFTPGAYRVRIPSPPSAFPLLTSVNNPFDDGKDHDSNGSQPAGVGGVVTSPLITLGAGNEPGISGTTNAENTIDFGFRTCPAIAVTPSAVAAATQYSAYSVNLGATGGAAPYTFAITDGGLPSGLSLSSSGMLAGTPDATAAPGQSYFFTVRATDDKGCTGTRTYTLPLLSATLVVTPPTLPGAMQYAPYSQPLTANGGTGPYTWSVSPALAAGAVSWWLAEGGPGDALGANHGVMHNGVSFTSGAIGSAFHFDGVDDRIEAADSAGLRPSLISLEAWVKPAGAGQPANGAVITKTSGASGTDGFGLGLLGTDDTFGFWINDRATNRLTASLPAGVWTHVVATYDGAAMRMYVNGGLVASKPYSSAILQTSAPLQIGHQSGAGFGWSGGIDEVVLYNRAITPAEVVARYQYTAAGNNGLPDGLSLNTATGALSGTPTSFPGTYDFYARATDVHGSPGVRAYSLAVSCPAISISPASMPNATQHLNYASQSLTAIGGTGPYAWSVFSGNLPAGMTLSSAGVLSGTPASAAGTYTFTVQARDANNCTATREYSLNVACPTITLSATTLANAPQFAAYSPRTLTASGGNEPYTFSIDSGALPSGMNLSSGGVISGTPSALPGSYSFTARVTDGAGCTGTRPYSITVACGAIAITPGGLPAAAKFSAYSQTLTASNGNGSYVWQLQTGSLPAGLTLSPAGVISGTCTGTPGSYPITVMVTDAQSCTATRNYSLAVNCPAATILPDELPDTPINLSYSQTLSVSGGAASYTWSIQSGSLPLGMSLSSSGALGGATLLPGNYSFVARAVDSDGCVLTRSYTLSVGTDCPAITISPGSLPVGQTNVAYNQPLTASGGSSPYSWVRTSGTLPSGMNLSSSGVISGTPTSGPGAYSFTVQVTDGSLGACTGSQTFTLTLGCSTIVITPAALPAATAGAAYSTPISSSGGTAPYTYSVIAGSLPPGLSLSGTGLLAGTPTSDTTASFTIESRDAYNCTATREYTLATPCPAIAIGPETLPPAYKDALYSQTLSVTSGTGPFVWAVVSGALPGGITLSSSGGLSGTPAAFGTSTFTARVTDAFGCTTTKNYSLAVQGLSLGNLVYDDANFNGMRNAGEAGVAGVTVQLWDPGADLAIGGTGPNADVQVGPNTTTNAQGAYGFQDLTPGRYYVRVLPPAHLPIPGGDPVNADNGVDNDNNAALQPGGPGTVIYGPVVELGSGGEPVSEDGDVSTDMTLDFGLFSGMSLGNLVWQDSNDNGLKDAAEPGLSGVTLELWTAGIDGLVGGSDDQRLRTTASIAGGAYSFTELPPGKFYVRIPTPPASHPLSSSSTAFTDAGINNDDNGHQVAAGSIYSPVITLAPGQEPGSSGATNTDNTLDFGLCNVTPTLYVSATQDDSLQTFNAATGAFTGYFHHPFGSSHNQGDGNPFDVPYGIELGPDGKWYVAHYGASNLRRITAAGVDQGMVLNNSGPNISLIVHFAIGADGNFYVVDESGNRIVRFHGPLSSTPGEPMDLAPYTFISQPGIQDLNIGPDGNLYVVVKDGVSHEIRRYSASTGELLNVIVDDIGVVNLVAGGQPVSTISGIDIHGSTLYGINKTDGEVFKVDLTDPTAPGLPQLVATLDSAGMGQVDTRDIELNPADGKLYIAGYNWGKPVIGGTYASGGLVKVDPAGAPNGAVSFFEVPTPTPPGPNNEIWAGPRDLAFGRPFTSMSSSVAIGSMVWNDGNANGLQDADEGGIPGVKVELWHSADGNLLNGAEALVGWTFTNSRGMYYFSGQAAGLYQVKIPASNFADGMPLSASGYSSPLTIPLDVGLDMDDNGIQAGGARTETVSPLILLTPGLEPVGDGILGTERGKGGELDDYVTDANGDMTVDFGFVEPGRMGIGNLVFLDANGNRRYDAGEGLDDVIVQLYYWGQTPGSDEPLASTVTANGGKYLFSNLWAGQYFVHLPASQFQVSGNLRGLYSLEGVQAGDDDLGEDSIDSGSPFDDGITTGRVVLTRDSVPINSSTETGVDANQDDADDANIDLTVDIGLFRPVALGNLIYDDQNSNGRADDGEGVEGITVQLYTFDQEPGVDPPVATSVSGGGGRYLFDFIRPGHYVVHVPAAMFASGAPLYQRVSIAEGLSGDDDVGENGLNESTPALDGVSSGIVSLFPGAAPTDDTGETGVDATSDNQNDASIDLTVDFGFQMPVGVGNLVFVDANGNGVADAGEGVDGVTLEIYRADQTPGVSEPLFNRVTANGGLYQFDFLQSGQYIVFVPSTNFGLGRPLGLSVSMAGAQTNDADDNQGEDGIDDATPYINGIRSRVITLTKDQCPVSSGGETGIDSDSDLFDDDNMDLTIDFGFAPANPNAVGIGNLVYRDTNGNALYDDGEGVDGVNVHLFPGLADPRTATPLATTVTTGGGIYLFSNLTAGEYIVHVPSSEFGPGAPLEGWTSLAGDGGDNGLDDDADENGVDSFDPAVDGVSSSIVALAPEAEPINAFSETGRDAFIDDSSDANVDLTVDFGFFKSVAVGNTVFLDANYNGRADSGEGLEGVEIQLFAEGMNPLFDQPLAITFSDQEGHYLINNLNPGSYFLHVSYQQFLSGGVLHRHASVAGTVEGDDNVGENGLDDGRPEFNGISTAVFTLSPSNCPTGTAEGGLGGETDDLNDASTDLTKDLGFVPRMIVGNAVFRDSNNDGVFDPNTEMGIDGVTVELWSNALSATTPLASMQTNNGGRYSFGIAPGAYQVRVPASQFGAGGALENLLPSRATPNAGGEFVDDDGGQDAYAPSANPVANGARTAFFTLLPGMAPVEDNGETGFLSFDDDLDDTNSDLTVDLGFAPKPLSVGNLVFADTNMDGTYTSGVDFGVPNVLLQLFEVGADPANSLPLAEAYSNAQGAYELFAPAPGDYFVHVPATQFSAGAPLAGASTVAGFGEDDGADDDINEDTLDSATPASTGVNSIVVTLAYGTEPSGASESGFSGGSDEAMDADKDLTVDLGFTGVSAPVDLGLGNLVFIDGNGNGRHDGGEGVSGVWMLLFRSGDDPAVSPPLRSTTTDNSGRYLFTNLAAGSYFVHVAADNFKPNISINGSPLGNGALFGRLSVDGNQSTSANSDDHLGEDGIDDLFPMKNGISSGLVSLAAGAAPTGAVEAGFSGTSDDAHDASYNLTIDFGFRAAGGAGNGESDGEGSPSGPAVASFAEWSAAEAAGGDPDADPDQDGATNLLEYALGTPPLLAMQGAPAITLTSNATTGLLEATITRPAGGRDDIEYILEAVADLADAPAGWMALAITPEVTAGEDGTEQVRFPEVAAAPMLAGGTQGYLRLKVQLRGTGIASVSRVSGWFQSNLGSGAKTFSMPLLSPDVFRGAISGSYGSSLLLSAASGLNSALTPGAEYYVEVVDGAHEGHRFELDEAATGDGTVVVDLSSSLCTLAVVPADLAGARIAIRRHWTIESLLPPALFTPAVSEANASRVQFLDPGSQTFYGAWLSDTAGWTGEVDGGYVVAPGEGLFVTATADITITYTGEVRENDFAQPLVSSAQLVGSGYPMWESPLSLDLTTAAGFIPAAFGAPGDQIQLWQGDAGLPPETYRSLLYFNSDGEAMWIDETAPTVDLSQERLFPVGRGFILAPQAAKPARVAPLPWQP